VLLFARSRTTASLSLETFCRGRDAFVRGHEDRELFSSESQELAVLLTDPPSLGYSDNLMLFRKVKLEASVYILVQEYTQLQLLALCLEAVMDSSSETRHWLISFGKPFSSGISEEEMTATPRLR
jgi:hypothetical protein